MFFYSEKSEITLLTSYIKIFAAHFVFRFTVVLQFLTEVLKMTHVINVSKFSNLLSENNSFYNSAKCKQWVIVNNILM